MTFSDTGSELRWYYFWLWIKGGGEFNFIFLGTGGVQDPRVEDHMGWDIGRSHIQAFPQFTAFGSATGRVGLAGLIQKAL